ncbi:oxidoreductase [Mycobacterium persicum]|uniref:2-dehydropantoate 2-reductase n=1 Tax=Mycobacterium persicum TaxID=1487726 RepID=A0A1X0LGY0_9MYCO|nr:2-dehydropantoate 2-reductase [Mycobacterium persicum]VAZ74661.1 Putative 2-dehydropantoate 2-reductase [Mycobacterium persicum]VAZ83425.1 Putative 2-dehydropantoate 2-reductase [Mycobacterium persicum]
MTAQSKWPPPRANEPGTLWLIASNIAVVGPGAVGTTVAALLHSAGHRVLLCGHTPRGGIELRPDGADPIVVPGPVHTDPDDVAGPVEVVILAVKATQNDDAHDWLARLCDEHTVVAVLQNGVEQVEQVQPHCPSSTVVPGSVWFSAETQPEGWVRLRGEAALVLPTGPTAEAVAELLRDAGARVDCDPDFTTVLWRKLVLNALAGLMALSGRRSGMFRRDDVAALSRRYVAECLTVARAEGARLGDDAVEEMVNLFRSAPEDMGTSILADREAHRRLEWDLRNGVIVRKARVHGLATPISDVVVPLLAAASDGPG